MSRHPRLAAWSIAGVVLSVPLTLATARAQPARPFPQHLSYGAGTILPNNRSRDELDDDVRSFYAYWKQQYLAPAGTTSDGDPLFRIAFGHPGTSKYGTTVSEGQGYGMIITVIMAGDDARARQTFDGLVRYSRRHPSSIDSRLMAWRVSQDRPRPGDDDSAFDGDSDMAFALLLADVQWGSNGDIDYAQQARSIIRGLMASVVGPQSRLPMLGDWVEPAGTRYNQYTQRTSDFMPANFEAFADTAERGRWRRVAVRSRRTARLLQRRFSREPGLLPDFVEPVSNTDTEPRPADAGFLEGEHDGEYSYNACRVPLRIGMDALLNGNRQSRRIVRRLSRWAERHHAGDPLAFRSGYRLDGTPVADGDFFSSGFVAPLGVAAMTVPAQQTWLNRVYEAVRDRHEGYYEDSLTLLSLLVMTGNFWS